MERLTVFTARRRLKAQVTAAMKHPFWLSELSWNTNTFNEHINWTQGVGSPLWEDGIRHCHPRLLSGALRCERRQAIPIHYAHGIDLVAGAMHM
jgi:hypothetical protein